MLRTIGLLSCLSLCACGTTVPRIGDWPNNTSAREGRMVQQIARSVGCELSYVVSRIVAGDLRKANNRLNRQRYTQFLDDWGVEVAINITAVERSAVNPNILIAHPTVASSIFNLNIGVSASSETTNVHKENIFFTIKELYRPDAPRCVPGTGEQFGSPLVDVDLDLFSLLEGRIGSIALGYANSPSDPVPVAGSKNALSSTVSFKITNSGNITPSWKLVRASIGPSGTLFGAGRDRTHELVMTFGPLDKKIASSLAPIAEAMHQNAQLRNEIRDSFRATQGF